VALPREGGEAQHRPQPRDQRLRHDGLGDVLVGFRVEATQLVLARVQPGQHHGGHVVGQPADLPADVQPGQVRQADVEQHQVGPPVPHRRERLTARPDRLDPKPSRSSSGTS
jgi:hypothetical protein